MAVRTTQLSGPAARIPDSSGRRAAPWTIRRSIAHSGPAPLTAAVVLAGIVLVTAAAASVELATAFTVVALVPAALVDVIERRLPNRLVAFGAVACAATAVAETMSNNRLGAPAALGAAALGSIAMAAPLLTLHLISPAAMGFGDVKFAAVLGAAVGLSDPMLGLLALTVASAATALGGLATRNRTLPFGPGLLFGAAVALSVSALSIADDWIPAASRSAVTQPATSKADQP